MSRLPALLVHGIDRSKRWKPRQAARVATALTRGLAALLSVLLFVAVERSSAQDRPTEATWMAGVATAKITPEGSMWMAGYAARKKPSEGVVQDLYAKALALEDAEGRRLVIVTLDLIGVPRAMRDAVEKGVQEKYQLPRASLMLNASHTHCGPELRVTRVPLEGTPEEVEDRLQRSLQYTAGLQTKLIELVGEALGQLKPARLDYQMARCGFAMNRRRPTPTGFNNAPNSDGPVDHRVPVLRVSAPDGALRAILFGYSCHNTTLGFDFFCGDYAGYAQQYLQEAQPGVVALFCMGGGGDQNPYPRRTVELAQQHGRSLANAVLAALETVPKPVTGPLVARYEYVTLEFAPPPSREELLKLAEGTAEPQRGHARRLLKQIEETGKIRDTYDYPVQVIDFGKDLTMVALGGELVVDYVLRLRKELETDRTLWVAGYSNDVFGYVPSLRVLQEGGYEGGGAMLWGSLPGPFAPSVEERIIGKVRELAGR